MTRKRQSKGRRGAPSATQPESASPEVDATDAASASSDVDVEASSVEASDVASSEAVASSEPEASAAESADDSSEGERASDADDASDAAARDDVDASGDPEDAGASGDVAADAGDAEVAGDDEASGDVEDSSSEVDGGAVEAVGDVPADEDEARFELPEGLVDPDAGRAGISSVGLIAGGDDDEIEITPRDRPGLEKAPPLPTGEAHLKGILESLLFVTDKPLPPNRLAKIARASTKEVQRLLDVLTEEYRGRGLELVEVAGGYQFRSSAENAPFVRELVARKPVRLTRAQIETLSILAYRQPITRPEVDEVRGVDSGSALKVLLEKGLVRIIGRKEEPGRPLLYGTTPYFLEFFGLPSLAELPTLREYSELSDESRALFQRRTGEAIDQIGELGVEARHYSEDEVEAEEAEAARRIHGEDEEPAGESEPPEPAAQGELALDGDSEEPPAEVPSENDDQREDGDDADGDDEDDDEDDDDEDDDEDDEDEDDDDDDDEDDEDDEDEDEDDEDEE